MPMRKEEPAGGAEFDPTTELSYAEVMQQSEYGESTYTHPRFPRRSTAGRAPHITNLCRGELVSGVP